MKTLQEQYNLIKEGKGHKGVFLKEAKRLFPNIVPNSATFNQTTKLLKQRSVISENIFPLIPSSGLNPFTTFDKFVNEEAKATEKKTTKEVEEAEIAGYDYKDPKNLDNQIFDQYLKGVKFELEQDPGLDLGAAREKVGKNLEKDPLFYMKNAAFGVEGIGYQELKNQEEPKGKHKSSGYGDLKENKMDSLNNFRQFLTEEKNFHPNFKPEFDKHPYIGTTYDIDGEEFIIVKVRPDSQGKGTTLIWQDMQSKYGAAYLSLSFFRDKLKSGEAKMNMPPENFGGKSALDVPNFVYGGFKAPNLNIKENKMSKSTDLKE